MLDWSSLATSFFGLHALDTTKRVVRARDLRARLCEVYMAKGNKPTPQVNINSQLLKLKLE